MNFKDFQIRNILMNQLITLIKNSLLITLSFMSVSSYGQDFDLQGHRGARGLLPENSLPAFRKALDIGVTTLELDVVISGDGKVVVSHEPWINSQICLDRDGKELTKDTGKKLNIYEMTYEQVRLFDCGSKEYKSYPKQEKVSVYKPLLSEMITETEMHIRESTGYPVHYNIEIKSNESDDNIYQPEPAEFSKLVYEVIEGRLPWDRVNIQSFDVRVLQYWHENYKSVTLAYLVENNQSLKDNLEKLGFKPDIYSPGYWNFKKEDVELLHSMGIMVIPWTVNKTEDMIRLRDWGVDGLITDYPDQGALLGMGVKIPFGSGNK